MIRAAGAAIGVPAVLAGVFFASYHGALAVRGPLRVAIPTYTVTRHVRVVRTRRVMVPEVVTVTAPAPAPQRPPWARGGPSASPGPGRTPPGHVSQSPSPGTSASSSPAGGTK